MKMLSVTLLLTLAVFLNSIESSQQTLLGRLRKLRGKVCPMPRIAIRLRGYMDETNTEQPLHVGRIITLGIRKINGINTAVGIDINGIIRPVIAYEGDKIQVQMIGAALVEVAPDEHMYNHYGLAPEDTIQARILNVFGD